MPVTSPKSKMPIYDHPFALNHLAAGIPTANTAAANKKLAVASWVIPVITWPLVHPSARRMPKEDQKTTEKRPPLAPPVRSVANGRPEGAPFALTGLGKRRPALESALPHVRFPGLGASYHPRSDPSADHDP